MERAELEPHRNSYQTHVAYAREAFEHAHLARHPNYAASKEARHHFRIITALRAAHNAKAGRHLPLLVEWLGHHNEGVVAESANALRTHESTFAERHILKQVWEQCVNSASKALLPLCSSATLPICHEALAAYHAPHAHCNLHHIYSAPWHSCVRSSPLSPTPISGSHALSSTCFRLFSPGSAPPPTK